MIIGERKKKKSSLKDLRREDFEVIETVTISNGGEKKEDKLKPFRKIKARVYETNIKKLNPMKMGYIRVHPKMDYNSPLEYRSSIKKGDRMQRTMENNSLVNKYQMDIYRSAPVSERYEEPYVLELLASILRDPFPKQPPAVRELVDDVLTGMGFTVTKNYQRKRTIRKHIGEFEKALRSAIPKDDPYWDFKYAEYKPCPYEDSVKVTFRKTYPKDVLFPVKDDEGKDYMSDREIAIYMLKHVFSAKEVAKLLINERTKKGNPSKSTIYNTHLKAKQKKIDYDARLREASRNLFDPCYNWTQIKEGKLL